MKFEEASKKYYEFMKLKLKNSTYIINKGKIDLYIINLYKNKDIFKFSMKDFINWQIYIDKLNFSYNYKSSLYYLFSEFLGFCIKYYGLKENVALKVGNFRNDSINNNGNIWTIEEYRKFIKKVDDPIYHALFNTLYFTGMRKGELLALTFNDLKDNKIFINKTITRYLDENKNKIITSPKTRSSNRVISINKYLLDEINKLKKYYKNKYYNYSDNFYIFGGINSISFTNLKRKKDYYCKLANVKQIKIHEFRHSHACLLFKNKIDIEDISYRLGHSSLSMTLDTYLKYLPKNEKKVVNLLNNLRIN